MSPGGLEILAHRAGPVRKGVPLHAEQTLAAFADTWARERVACECDVRFTADREPVVFHDATLQRITGREGYVHELDRTAFRALRADILGAGRTLARADKVVRLATLDEVLRFARRSGAHLNVEAQEPPGGTGLRCDVSQCGRPRREAARFRHTGPPPDRAELLA